jgi:hypothetical protein
MARIGGLTNSPMAEVDDLVEPLPNFLKAQAEG